MDATLHDSYLVVKSLDEEKPSLRRTAGKRPDATLRRGRYGDRRRANSELAAACGRTTRGVPYRSCHRPFFPAANEGDEPSFRITEHPLDVLEQAKAWERVRVRQSAAFD